MYLLVQSQLVLTTLPVSLMILTRAVLKPVEETEISVIFPVPFPLPNMPQPQRRNVLHPPPKKKNCVLLGLFNCFRFANFGVFETAAPAEPAPKANPPQNSLLLDDFLDPFPTSMQSNPAASNLFASGIIQEELHGFYFLLLYIEY